MKSITAKAMVLMAICATIFSFSPKPGGEGFEIMLNHKVLLQRFGNEMNAVKSLSLDQPAANDQLIIKYYHCGQAGKNRILTLKNAQDKMLREWHFGDASNPAAGMTLPIKDILALQKAGNGQLQLCYSSTELPKGRLLTILTPAITTAKL